MAPHPSILEVERLSVTRNGTRILQKVDWTIRQGTLGVDGSQWLWQDHALSSLLGYFVPPRGRFSCWVKPMGKGLARTSSAFGGGQLFTEGADARRRAGLAYRHQREVCDD